MNNTNSTTLRAQAKSLQTAAQHLLDAADVLDQFDATPHAGDKAKKSAPTANPGNRLDQLRDFLAKSGPLTRAAIIKGSPIPKGTIVAYLKPDKGFIKNSEGLWAVAKEEK